MQGLRAYQYLAVGRETIFMLIIIRYIYIFNQVLGFLIRVLMFFHQLVMFSLYLVCFMLKLEDFMP